MKNIHRSLPFLKAHTPFVVFALLCFYSCKTKQTATAPIQAEKRRDSSHEEGTLSSKNLIRFEYNFYNANKEKILGNYDNAAKLFFAALDANPNSAAAMYELANIFEQKQNIPQALYYSKKAMLLDPENTWYQLLYINCLKDARKWPEVGTIYQQLIKQHPDNVDYYYELANSYLYQNKSDDAIKVYDNVEKRFGRDKDISLQKIKIYQVTKQPDKAIEEAQGLIKENPNEYSYYGILGDLYQGKGDTVKALGAYQDMLKVAPDNPYAHLTLADYYRNQQQDDKAFNEIAFAFKSKDLDIDTKVKILLSYYYVSEKFKEIRTDAYKLCELLVQAHPNEAKSYSIYGDFLYRDKKLEDARTQYRKSISLDKEKYTLWSQLLLIDSELEDNISLQKESKEAIELFPTQPFPYLFNGSANSQLKNYADALVSFNQGKDYVIDNPNLLSQFYGYIGDAQNQLKNYAQSDSAYEKALQLDNTNAMVMNNYAYYLSLRNVHLESAEKMSKKSNELDPNNNSFEDTYGWVLYKMGKYNNAKIWIAKAIKNAGTDNGTLLEHYGDILYKLGDIDNAVMYWQNAKKAGGATDLIDKKIADKKLYE